MRKYQDVIDNIVNPRKNSKPSQQPTCRESQNLKKLEELRKINYLLQQQKNELITQYSELGKLYKKECRQNKTNYQKRIKVQKQNQQLKSKLKKQQNLNIKIERRLYSLNTTKKSSKYQTQKTEHLQTCEPIKTFQDLVELTKDKIASKTFKSVDTQTTKQIVVAKGTDPIQQLRTQKKISKSNIKRLENIIERQKELISNYECQLSQSTRITGRIVKSKSFINKTKS